jgi:hypothetical protein
MAYRYIGDPLTNPFLNMLNLMDEGAPAQAGQPVVQQAAPVLPAAPEGTGRVKLPQFWPQAPGIWFARAELRFETSGVTSQRQKFAYVADALPYESLCLVADLVESPPAAEPYNILKDRLMMSHQLTPVQKAMKLLELPDLGNRRPSQLLADLLQDCPAGEQETAFFRASFLKRLPAEVQVHLSKTDALPMKELAQQADQLYLSHRRAAGVAAAVAVEEVAAEDAMLAAVAGKLTGKQPQQQQKKKNKKLVTYCWVHHKFGKTARKCDNPAECMWEN